MGNVSAGYVWATGDTITAARLNANPNAFIAGFKNIDSTNIGAAGINAANINTGTFGGSGTATFPGGVAAGGALTATTGVFSSTVSMTALTATTGTFSGAVSMTALTASTGAFSGDVTLATTNLIANGVVLISGAPAVSAGRIGLGTTLIGTVGAAGSAAALPSNPANYLVINAGGSAFKIPIYNP